MNAVAGVSTGKPRLSSKPDHAPGVSGRAPTWMLCDNPWLISDFRPSLQVVGYQTQLVDAVASTGFEQTRGLHHDCLLVHGCLHRQHRFTEHHQRGPIGQSGCFGPADQALPARSVEVAAHLAGSLSSRFTPMHEAGLRSKAARAVKPKPGANSTTSSEAPNSGRACISCVGSRPPGCDTRLAHLRPAASTRVSCCDPGLYQTASHRNFRMQDPYIFNKLFIDSGVKYAFCRNKQFDRFRRGTDLVGSIGEPCASSSENGTTGTVSEPPTTRKRQDVPNHPL